MAPIVNPVLPGFHPDPSLCAAGGKMYIATSTFEWYPGVEIHVSTDGCATWALAARPLARASQLDMRGFVKNRNLRDGIILQRRAACAVFFIL